MKYGTAIRFARPSKLTGHARVEPRRKGFRTPHDVVGRRARCQIDRRRSGELQPAGVEVGTSYLRPRVPGDWPRGRRARRLPGNLPSRLSRAERLPRPGEILLVAVSYRAESVPGLGPQGTANARRPGARRTRGARNGRRTRAGSVSRRPGGPPRAHARGRTRDGAAARRATHGNHPEGVPRADVPGNRGPGRLSAEHGEDAPVPGPGSPATRAREES